MKISKILPIKIPFFDKNRNKNDSPRGFVLLFTLFASRAIWKPFLSQFKILSCTNNRPQRLAQCHATRV